MNQRSILFRRAGVFYCEDRTTRKQTSLRTRDKGEALRLLQARNEAVRQPVLNLQIARAYLTAGDPALTARIWQHVMEQILATKTGSTRERWDYAIADSAFDLIRHRKLVETSAEHFLAVLRNGSVSTNVYLRRTHNYALGLNWLPWAVLPRLHWPPVKYKGQARHHPGGTREDHPARAQPRHPRLSAIALALGRLAIRHRHAQRRRH